ncbi:MAG: hypothetical protein ACYDC6_04740 [Acidobacteriaceae bacterium]
MASRQNMHVPKTLQMLRRAGWAVCVFGALSLALSAAAQQTPQQLVQQVVDKEVVATQDDHSEWMYRDAYKSPSKNIVKLVVETSRATLSRLVEKDGHALTPQQQSQDRAKMEKLVHDSAERARQRKDAAHDDLQSLSLMEILPNAFLWKEVGRANGQITLHFEPNPAFQPPTYSSRVFAAMAGEMVVDAQQKRLVVLRGKLIRPVEFGWGLLGKLQRGGTFHVVRSEIGPGIWQITQTHIHIEGRVLFFKSISEQEDEVDSNYKPTPPGTTLSQASSMLSDGTVARLLDVEVPR